MKLGVKIGTVLVCLLMATTIALPQDQAKTPAGQPASHLRVDFLLSQYNGQQKISSLPYTISMEAGPGYPRNGSIRMGIKIPVALKGDDHGPTVSPQFEYESMGTNIDCVARPSGDGAYGLDVTVNGSYAYTEAANATQTDGQALRAVGGHPVIQTFGSSFSVALRDGETREGVSETDPSNGHVLKISVTLHVIK